MTPTTNQLLFDEVTKGNLPEIYRLLHEGADVNIRGITSESLLKIALYYIDDLAARHKVLSVLLESGADPTLLDKDGSGPLFSAVVVKDTVALSMLLDSGANPNREHDLGEPLLDWAEFDYRFDEYDLSLPERPTEADKANFDAWLAFLDRLAIKYNKRRPDYLLLLRQRGALTQSEM